MGNFEDVVRRVAMERKIDDITRRLSELEEMFRELLPLPSFVTEWDRTVPDWVNFQTTDAYGIKKGFSHRPDFDEQTGQWYSEAGECIFISRTITHKFNYKDSLVCRYGTSHDSHDTPKEQRSQ